MQLHALITYTACEYHAGHYAKSCTALSHLIATDFCNRFNYYLFVMMGNLMLWLSGSCHTDKAKVVHMKTIQ